MRVLLAQLQLEMQYLQRQIEESDKLILRIASELEPPCRRLVAIPGIGTVIATATIATIIGKRSNIQKGPLGWEWFQASTLPEAGKH